MLFTARITQGPHHHVFNADRARHGTRCPSQPIITVECSTLSNPATAKHARHYNWNFDKSLPAHKAQRLVRELPVTAIARPLGKTRANDQDKVAALMESIEEIGLQEPIDVLEVDGKYFGFSGCHRFEAHVKLGKLTILCRVRKATPKELKLHMM